MNRIHRRKFGVCNNVSMEQFECIPHKDGWVASATAAAAAAYNTNSHPQFFRIEMVKFRNGLDSKSLMLFFHSNFFLLLSRLVFISCHFFFPFVSSSVCMLCLFRSFIFVLTLSVQSYLTGASQFNSTYLSLSVYLYYCCCCCWWLLLVWFGLVWFLYFFGWENQGTIHIWSCNTQHTEYVCVLYVLCVYLVIWKKTSKLESILFASKTEIFGSIASSSPVK